MNSTLKGKAEGRREAFQAKASTQDRSEEEYGWEETAADRDQLATQTIGKEPELQGARGAVTDPT